MKILLVVCTLLHDMVRATIISNYCLQAQLLTSYAYFLREKLLQHRVQPIEWMRVGIFYGLNNITCNLCKATDWFQKCVYCLNKHTYVIVSNKNAHHKIVSTDNSNQIKI